MNPKRSTLSDVIREAVTQDGRSLARLAQESGVSHTILSRFLRNERDITLGTAERLCRVLALELRSVQRKGRC